MARLIPNPAGDLIRRVDGVLENVDGVLGRVDGTLSNVDSTLTTVSGTLGNVDGKLASKAERFIQTLQNRWAYGALYRTSAERSAALPGWLTHYNFTRRHGALGHKPPAARLAELEQRVG